MTKIVELTHATLTDAQGQPKKIWFVMGPGITIQRLTDKPWSAITTVKDALPVLETPEQIMELFNRQEV